MVNKLSLPCHSSSLGVYGTGLMAILLSGTLVELPYDTPPPPTASLARFNLHTTLSDIKAALSQKSVRASK